MSRLLDRRLLVAVLAVSLAIPLVPFGGENVRAQDNCTDHEHEPLWITLVDIYEPSRFVDDDDNPFFTDHGGAYVEPDTQLKFDLEITNRLAGTCDLGQIGHRTDQLNLRTQYVLEDGSIFESHERLSCSGTSGNREIQPTQTCSHTNVTLPTNDREVVNDDGEHRIRFIVYDDDADDNDDNRPDDCATPNPTEADPNDDAGACAGAERVVVVGQLPDLIVNKNIEWNNGPNAFTSYGGDITSEFTVTVENNGDYPNWNPNWRSQDENKDAGKYWGRSSYDGDGDNAPDAKEDYQDPNLDQETSEQIEDRYERSYNYTTHQGPVCRWSGTGNADDTTDGTLMADEYRCSYRRGEIMHTPVFYEVRRDKNGPVTENGSQLLHDVSEQTKGTANDKLHAVTSGGSEAIPDLEAVDHYKRAGEFHLQFEVGRENSTFFVPESDEDNNEADTSIDIKGVDLTIEKPRVVVETSEGGTQEDACLNQSNPCQLKGSTINVDPTYQNDGDDLDDAGASAAKKEELLDISWRGNIFLNGELQFTEKKNRVPEEDADPDTLLTRGRDIDPPSGGGEATIKIRLDHRDDYVDESPPITDVRGKVGERTEDMDCKDDTIDNNYCITFWFVDKNEPTIHDDSLEIVNASDDPVPKVTEGENVTFRAKVVDSSLTNVTAVFEHPDGTPANFTRPDGSTFSELEMHPGGEEDFWNVTTSFTGNLSKYVYSVRAEDISHSVNSSGTEFELVQREVEVTIDDFVVNGEPSSLSDDAPRYRGTKESPDNVFNISASINGSGHPESSTDGKELAVYRPNGTLIDTLNLNTTQACVVNNTITGDKDTRTGDGCNVGDTDTEEVEEEWSLFWANSTRPLTDGPELDLDFAGIFSVEYRVNDTFGRTATADRSARIQDQINDNGEEEPILKDVSISPTDVEPGGTIEAVGNASDVLWVENVTLNLTKPSGDSVQAELKISDPVPEEQETRSGVYDGVFDVGPRAEFFDQGGTYEARVVAEDFARNFNESNAVSVDVNDSQRPEIVNFDTIPSEAQEVGGTITWVATIDDDMAVRPPELTVQRANAGPKDLTMRFNESENRWKAGPLNATDATVGEWTYELDVEDYTGKVASATGNITVAQNLPPQAQHWQPNVIGPAGGSYGPPAPTISVQVVDFGQGVNKSTIEFEVNDQPLEKQDYQQTPIPNVCSQCYQLNYTPPTPYNDTQTVSLKVLANDTTENAATLRHSFQVDAKAPTASLEMGPALTRGDTRVIGLPTQLNVSVDDGGSGPGVTRVTVVDTDANGSRQTIKVAGDEGTFRLQDFDKVAKSHGVYQVFVDAADAVGNSDTAAQRSVLFDKLGPSIDVFAKPGKPRELVFANVTDDSRVQKVTAIYSVDDGPQQKLALEEDDGTWNVRLFNQRTEQAFQEGSTVRFTVEASDIFGNVRSSSQKNFTAGDSVPTISFDSPEEGETISDTTELSWTANDAETRSGNLKISLFYKQPGGTFQEIAGAQDIVNRGAYNLDTTTLPNGRLTLQVFVLDGQNFAADEVNVTVRNLGETFSAPEIEGVDRVDGQNVLAPEQESTFRVQIDGDVRRAWANITDGESVVDSVELENVGGSTWQASFTAPTEKGNYSVTLSAVTEEGVEEAPAAYAFSVQGSPAEADNFIPEWTLLTALTATSVALGVLGLRNRWT